MCLCPLALDTKEILTLVVLRITSFLQAFTCCKLRHGDGTAGEEVARMEDPPPIEGEDISLKGLYHQPLLFLSMSVMLPQKVEKKLDILGRFF
jgi:hypothetical protein